MRAAQAIEISRDADAVLLRATFVNVATPLGKPLCVRFGLIEPAEVLTSLYVRPDRSGAMIIVFNGTAAPRSAAVRVNRSALKLNGGRPEDCLRCERLEWEGERFRCRIGPHTFRMVAIE